MGELSAKNHAGKRQNWPGHWSGARTQPATQATTHDNLLSHMQQKVVPGLTPCCYVNFSVSIHLRLLRGSFQHYGGTPHEWTASFALGKDWVGSLRTSIPQT